MRCCLLPFAMEIPGFRCCTLYCSDRTYLGSVYMPTFGCLHHFFTLRSPFLFLISVWKVSFQFPAFGIPWGLSGKEPTLPCRSRRRLRFDPWSGRSPGEGNGNPFQCSCLEKPLDIGAWWATVLGVTESRTRLK